MTAEKETAGVLGRPHHLDGTKALDHAKSQGNPYVIRLFDNYHQIYKYQRDIIGKDYMPKNQYAKDSTGPGVKGTRIYVPVQTQIVRIFFKIVGAGAVCTVAIGIWSWLRHPLRPAVEVEYQRWRRRQPRRWLWRWLSGRFCYRCRQAWMRYARFIDSGDDEQNDFNLEVDRLWQWLARLLPRIAQWHLDILARGIELCGLCQRRWREVPQPRPPQRSARRQKQAQPKPSAEQQKTEEEARRKGAAKHEREQVLWKQVLRQRKQVYI